MLDPYQDLHAAPRQIANGLVDAFVHTMEQYLTHPVNAPAQDRFAEGLLQTLIELAPRAMQEGEPDYDNRASLMWTATLALNGLIGAGVPQDWATHMIGHELTALYGIDHARTLAIVLPQVMQARREAKREKLLQYAARHHARNQPGDSRSRTLNRVGCPGRRGRRRPVATLAPGAGSCPVARRSIP